MPRSTPIKVSSKNEPTRNQRHLKIIFSSVINIATMRLQLKNHTPIGDNSYRHLLHLTAKTPFFRRQRS